MWSKTGVQKVASKKGSLQHANNPLCPRLEAPWRPPRVRVFRTRNNSASKKQGQLLHFDILSWLCWCWLRITYSCFEFLTWTCYEHVILFGICFVFQNQFQPPDSFSKASDLTYPGLRLGVSVSFLALTCSRSRSLPFFRKTFNFLVHVQGSVIWHALG